MVCGVLDLRPFQTDDVSWHPSFVCHPSCTFIVVTKSPFATRPPSEKGSSIIPGLLVAQPEVLHLYHPAGVVICKGVLYGDLRYSVGIRLFQIWSLIKE